MQEIILDLTISPDEYLKLYRGEADSVYTQSLDGRRVRFPAAILQRFISHEGIRGRFVIRFNGEGRFHGIRRL